MCTAIGVSCIEKGYSNFVRPHGEREDVRGLRFGIHPGSRVEFTTLPESVEHNLAISLELRSNSANGIILFISNEKHSDHVALYILDGKVCLSYGSGNVGPPRLKYWNLFPKRSVPSGHPEQLQYS